MTPLRVALAGVAGALLLAGSPLAAQAPALVPESAFKAMATEAARYPLFAEELARTRAEVDAAMKRPIDVPVPKDPGGGATHEQHKRNYAVIRGAGLLFRITGERKYADHARDILLAYAKLYPGLGPHPAKANQNAGRLFWQSLNDSVWLVQSIQGYDAIRGALTAAERKTIEDGVFRPMARFLSEGSPHVFNRIHNHATWANAGVGMTGYVLGDKDLVEKALLGLDKSGKAGFLRQLDLLFSPDGYYAEGPYYQRYALQPFVVFASAIQANDPGRKIFEYRGRHRAEGGHHRHPDDAWRLFLPDQRRDAGQEPEDRGALLRRRHRLWRDARSGAAVDRAVAGADGADTRWARRGARSGGGQGQAFSLRLQAVPRRAGRRQGRARHPARRAGCGRSGAGRQEHLAGHGPRPFR